MSIFKLVFLNQSTGELNKVPDQAIVPIGGVTGPTFTVGGKSVLLDDGTSSGVDLSLQTVYANSTTAEITLSSTKPLVLSDGSSVLFSVDSSTGTVLVNGINFIDFYNDFTSHTHPASDISTAGPFNLITGANVEAALLSIDSLLNAAISGNVLPYRHDQPTAALTWEITHDLSSTSPIVTVYDISGEQILPDAVTIIDSGRVDVSFNTAQAGFAVLLLYFNTPS